jgi:hypothetical protein
VVAPFTQATDILLAQGTHKVMNSATGKTSPAPTGFNQVLRQDKKKGCKKSKCSNWKGGQCKCGRD